MDALWFDAGTQKAILNLTGDCDDFLIASQHPAIDGSIDSEGEVVVIPCVARGDERNRRPAEGQPSIDIRFVPMRVNNIGSCLLYEVTNRRWDRAIKLTMA